MDDNVTLYAYVYDCTREIAIMEIHLFNRNYFANDLLLRGYRTIIGYQSKACG
jgi:hypothetical protein